VISASEGLKAEKNIAIGNDQAAERVVYAVICLQQG
jgi:hypothetical protein